METALVALEVCLDVLFVGLRATPGCGRRVGDDWRFGISPLILHAKNLVIQIYADQTPPFHLLAGTRAASAMHLEGPAASTSRPSA